MDMNEHTINEPTVEQVLQALKHVTYPGAEHDIVSSGMVQDDVAVEGNRVSFSLRFQKARDPFQKSVTRAAERALKNYISTDIEVEINPLLPAAPASAEPERPLPGVKNIIAVSSGKGGVGKSTITTNLAVALARLGKRVGLLDADIYGPSIPRMMGAEDARPLLTEVNGKELIDPVERYGVKLLSIGFFVDPDNALIWRGTMASNALGQLINEGNWGELDYLLLDLPPGTSDIHLTLIQTLGITGALVVTTPQQVATDDARKGIGMFQDEKVGVPILGIVENMSWFTPAELPQNRYYIFGKDGAQRLADETGTTVIAQIPLVQSVRESADEGKPIALQETIMGQAFMDFAAKVEQITEERNQNLAPTKKVEVTKK